jgi:hypothetical protein
MLQHAHTRQCYMKDHASGVCDSLWYTSKSSPMQMAMLRAGTWLMGGSGATANGGVAQCQPAHLAQHHDFLQIHNHLRGRVHPVILSCNMPWLRTQCYYSWHNAECVSSPTHIVANAGMAPHATMTRQAWSRVAQGASTRQSLMLLSNPLSTTMPIVAAARMPSPCRQDQCRLS